MAQIKMLSRDKYRVTVDYKGVRKKKTMIGSKAQAQQWGLDREKEIEATGTVAPEQKLTTLGELVEAYEKDMAENGIHFSNTKSYNLFKIREQVGAIALSALGKQDVIAFGKKLAKTRGPNGVKERLNYLSKALKWGKSHKDYPLQPQITAVADAITVLGTYKLVGDAVARKSNPSDAQIDQIKATFKTMRGSNVDMADIIDVLRVLPLRVGELCSIEWDNLNPVERSVKLWRKPGFWQVVALPVIGGIDTYKLIAGRPRHLVRPFPYASKTVSSYFWLGHKMAGVQDVHLHDLRAHAITWLRDQGLPKEQAKALMGHTRDSKVLDQVYTRYSAEQVHGAIERTGIDKMERRRTGDVVPLRAA